MTAGSGSLRRSRASAESRTDRLTGAMVRLASGGYSASVNAAGWLIFCLGTLVLVGQLFTPVEPQGEGQLLSYPWLIAHGSIPYRDIWMSYPPMDYLMLAALMKAGIPGLAAARGLSLVARLSSVLLLNRALTGAWFRASLLGIPVSFSLLLLANGGKEASPWVIGMPFLLLALLVVPRRPYVAAALFFAAGSIRLSLGVAGCIALLVLAVLLPSRQAALRRQYLQACLALGAALSLLLAGLTILSGGYALRDIALDPAFVIGPTRFLPLFPSSLGPFGVSAELLVILSPLVLAAAALALRRPFVVATTVGVSTLLFQFVQRADWPHLFTVGAVTVPWTLYGMTELLREGPSPGEQRDHETGYAPRLLGGWIALIGLILVPWYVTFVLVYNLFLSPLSPAASGSLFRHWSGYLVPAGQNSIIATPAEGRGDEEVMRYIGRHSSGSDSLFVAPVSLRYLSDNETVLYFLLRLKPATRYLEMLPGLEQQAPVQRQIIARLHHCRWVVLWNGDGGTDEPNAGSRPGSALLERYVQRHYRLVLENATYQVLEQR